ncbi:MFS transporter [Flavisolibacter tropicus]|uniref:MFS transporter n=1 Tax=Flavisolibacter tropicus TaxID=1492898 RepID=UPI00082BB74E|nr:MFS transporter [Flavisolibacter tropicus]
MRSALLIFIISFFAVALGAMDSVMSAAYLPEILQSMNYSASNPESSMAASWINFSFLAGGTIGGIVMGFLADRIGRRITLTLALLFYGAGSGLGVLVTEWPMMALTRFLVGIGVGTALVLSAVVVSETWPSRTKAVALGILAVAYPVGIIASGAITSSIADWQTAFLIGAIPVILAIPVFILVKETYKAPEKRSSIDKRARRNIAFGIVVYGTMLIGLWSTFLWLPTWVQTLIGDNAQAGIAKRGMAVALLGMGGLIGSIISGWMANRWGPKTMQGICFILCFILSVAMFLLIKKFSDLVLVGSALLGLLFGISQGVLNSFIPQLFTENIRSGATGLCFHVGRGFTAIAVFFVGVLAMKLGGYGRAISIFSVVYIIGFIALSLMKKTGGKYASH